MPGLLLTTKLQVPQIRSERVPRSRLVARLQQGLAYKLILVSAPAGYGKTTVLCEWLATCGQPSAWISLDKRDNDSARFWAYLQAALQRTTSTIENRIPDILHNYDDAPDLEALLTDLINDLDKLQQPLILVLDDYHNIDTQSIHDGLNMLLEHAPAQFHMVLSTRADPPLPLARFRARSEMLELRQYDLCFTVQEAADFLHHTMRLKISEEDIDSITARTEGWIAGLQMAGLSLQGKEDPSAFIRSFSGENRYILDFLFEEVFQRQPREIQDFLLRTCILDQLCGALCDAVNLRADGQTMLGILENSNLFLISLDDRRKWYRYHHLFSDLLQSRLKQTFPDEIASLHQRASAWYAAENILDSAIAHALAAKDFERAASLIESFLSNEEPLNNLVALRSWMEKLPMDILERHPWLCVYRAWVDFETGQRETLEDRLRTVEKSIESLDADDTQRQHIQGHIAGLHAYSAFTREDIPHVLEMGQKALSLLPADDRMRSSAAIILGAAYWASGDVIQAEWSFRMARDAALKSSSPRAAPASCYIGLQQVKQGRLQDAIDTFQDGLRLATLPNGNETFLAGFPNVRLGDVYREGNQLELASQHLTKGLAQSKRLGQMDVLVDAYACLGRFQLAVGELDSAHESIQSADWLTNQTKVDQWVLAYLDDLRLRLWLAKGDLDAAGRWAQKSGLSSDGALSYQHDLHHQNLARLLVAQSIVMGSKRSHDDAAALLKRLLPAAKQAGWVHEQIKILIMQAINYQTHKDSQAALMSLYHAVILAEPGGYVRVFLDEGEIIRGLLTALGHAFRDPSNLPIKDEGIDLKGNQVVHLQKYVSMLLSEFDHSPETSSAARSTMQLKGFSVPNTLMVEQLSPREIEVLKLLAQGCSDKEIAESLVIARETVHKHLKNIYGKLGVHSRTEALAQAHKLELL